MWSLSWQGSHVSGPAAYEKDEGREMVLQQKSKLLLHWGCNSFQCGQ